MCRFIIKTEIRQRLSKQAQSFRLMMSLTLLATAVVLTVVFCLMSMVAPVLTAMADYNRVIEYSSSDISVVGGLYYNTPNFTAPDTGKVFVSLSLSSGANPNTVWRSSDGGSTPTVSLSGENNLTAGKTYHLEMRNASNVSGVTLTLVFSGSDPDLGVKSQEQRYNTNTLYSADFTQSNSLPLIYSGSLFLSDFTPNGNCNSIQVDASTVGGDQLEWRLNLGQSGIDGQSAWVPIGFKLPLEVGAFDEHSIQLRMKDPNDPTQYYQLQPSELSMCSVSYGYMTDVYLSLPPAEYQTLPTEEMPTLPTYTVPTAPDVSQFVSAPASVLTSIFNMFMASPVAIVFTLLIFAFVIKCVIW